MKDIMSNLQQTNSEKILLSWVRQCSAARADVNVLNFTTSWADGLAFNAILHRFRSGLGDGRPGGGVVGGDGAGRRLFLTLVGLGCWGLWDVVL